jgi:hypothetical protein
LRTTDAKTPSMRVAPIGERGNHRSGLVPGDKGEEAMKTVQQRQHLATTVRRAIAGIALGLLAQAGSPATARAQYAFTTLDMPGAVATYADGNSVDAASWASSTTPTA